MLFQPAMLLGGLLLTVAAMTVAQRRGQEARGRRRAHRVQYGQCSYTFVLPEPEPCPPEPEAFRASNSLQRDSPASALNLGDWPTKRVQRLEKVLENNTQWLRKLERYIQRNFRPELSQVQQHMVQNHTATMLELGTSILNQTTARARKLTDVEAQVLNQTSRMKIQLLETSLSTNKLEKQLLLQGHELYQLQGYNSALEMRVEALETQQQAELASLRGQKEQLRRLLSRQNGALTDLQRSLRAASSNSNLLQLQQHQLLESVQHLLRLVAQGTGERASVVAAEQVFQDCTDIQRFGANASGIYTIRVANMTEPRKVFCDMDTNGGGWTLIQRREDGSVNFQRKWKDYKQGFGDPAGEHWLGNELVHQLTSRAAYSLRLELQDWEGNKAYAQYEHFQLGSEEQLYRLSLSGYSGSAGHQSSLVLQGTNFSTQDADNDNCLCKCAQMLSGGWWFDACGLSNLNGIYYPAHNHVRKLNGIRWHYFQGASYSLHATRMMVRPTGI
ncbi:angiopoietin-4 isoform X1 [Phyllostomus hastatus]|uniref:angiopoietin-4 isoform X1 n=1 Tax=Phyllostomus hastatus TaxID=9423 RepID=UPI001E683597|nr:angiopoietin-4 isoform X1 [Phyllostomus hastatus]